MPTGTSFGPRPGTVTASRWTFVVGKDGKILFKNTKVDAPKGSAGGDANVYIDGALKAVRKAYALLNSSKMVSSRSAMP